MNNEFILLLGANQFQRERALIGAEKAYGGKVVTVSPLAPFHTNKYPSTTIFSNETNPEQLLTDLITFINKRKMKIKGVIPLNDFVLNSGSMIAEYFKLSYNSKQTIKNCRTKDLMKSVLLENNLPVTKSYRFTTLGEAKSLAKTIGYPLVIKPLNFGGSGGVVKVEDENELDNKFLLTQTHIKKYAKKYDSDDEQMLIESYIPIKQEVSVEVINTPNFRKVIGITDKFLSNEPYFSEIGHRVPSYLTENKLISIKIEEMALKVCDALNISYGMAHVEMKVGLNGEIVIIEVGARTAGDGIMDLYEKSTHKNIYELHCKAYLDRLTQEELPNDFFNMSAIGYLHPIKGIIEDIKIESISRDELDNIDIISIQSNVGQRVEPAKDWSTRFGYIEYTLPISFTNFDVIKKTSSITNKIFSIREE